jgi:hypothetical protein
MATPRGLCFDETRRSLLHQSRECPRTHNALAISGGREAAVRLHRHVSLVGSESPEATNKPRSGEPYCRAEYHADPRVPKRCAGDETDASSKNDRRLRRDVALWPSVRPRSVHADLHLRSLTKLRLTVWASAALTGAYARRRFDGNWR